MNHIGTPRADVVDFPTALATLGMNEAALLAALLPGELAIVSACKRAVTRAAMERITPGSTSGLGATAAQNVISVNDSARW